MYSTHNLMSNTLDTPLATSTFNLQVICTPDVGGLGVRAVIRKKPTVY